MLDEKRVNHENTRNITKKNHEQESRRRITNKNHEEESRISFSRFVLFRVFSWFLFLLQSMNSPCRADDTPNCGAGS